MAQFSLVEYVEDEKSYFAEWFTGLDAAPAARIDRYVRRMEFGNFGDSKSVGEGVRELRIDLGPGYRVYYGIDQGRIVLLLGGGTKRGQSRDIRKAIDRWTTYKGRKR
ncbi:MAG: type II toxin-antitoxin system RelE/ParE family toxin [Spirochaetes bacterium]|jgi:putative addiction module killer protein|nr:type II toxin-antitoxin system RelE/ParE family toxin [Spirochaetota bacterium]